MREPIELVEFLAPYPDSVQALALAARVKLLGHLWPVTEIFYDAVNAVCSGFTYVERVTGNFVNLAVYPDHVTLIFPDGAKLQDTEGRLNGGGNRVRHLRLVNLATLDDPYVIDLVDQASALAARPAEAGEPGVIVKVMNGKKKRPTR